MGKISNLKKSRSWGTKFREGGGEASTGKQCADALLTRDHNAFTTPRGSAADGTIECQAFFSIAAVTCFLCENPRGDHRGRAPSGSPPPPPASSDAVIAALAPSCGFPPSMI